MYRLNEEKVFFDIADGQAVVINFTTGMYYGTDALGSAVLEQLIGGVSETAIAEAVSKAAGCPSDFAAKLDAFIKKLVEKEILTAADGEESNSAAFDDAVFAEGFELSVDEFSEVQDLLLADPVHDVDVSEGWPILKDEN